MKNQDEAIKELDKLKTLVKGSDLTEEDYLFLLSLLRSLTRRFIGTGDGQYDV